MFTYVPTIYYVGRYILGRINYTCDRTLPMIGIPLETLFYFFRTFYFRHFRIMAIISMYVTAYQTYCVKKQNKTRRMAVPSYS